jgi:hypothetical protein
VSLAPGVLEAQPPGSRYQLLESPQLPELEVPFGPEL